jgi:hypothetical protein
MDWGAWSREAVAMMSERSRRLEAGAAYRWDLDDAQFVLGEATYDLTVVGTVLGDSFLWSWANEAIPARAKTRIAEVRQFGVEHDLPLLREPRAPGGLPQGKECVAVAGRILDADAVWIRPSRSPTEPWLFFVLHTAASR